MSQMKPQDKDAYQLWRSSNLDVLEKVMREKTTVTLSLPTGMDGASAPLKLEGLFGGLNGSVARFFVRKSAPALHAPVHVAKCPMSCDVGFTNMQPSVTGNMEPIGYSGSGEILEIEKGHNGLPQYLTVRVSHRFTTRRVRRHVRLDWKDQKQAMVGLQVVNPVPDNRQQLRGLLEVALRDAASRPTLVNLSAGGACLCVDKDLVTRPLAGHEYYLFVFSYLLEEQKRPPEILLGKKVGLRRDVCGEGLMGLRLKFVRELNWYNSQVALAWRDIADEGSAYLNALIDKLCREYFPQQAQ